MAKAGQKEIQDRMAKQIQQIQKVYIEWCVKAAEIILDARLDPQAQDAVEPPLQTSASFGLKVPELWNVRGEAIARPEFFQVKTQRSFQIELFLMPPSEPSSASAAARSKPGSIDGATAEEESVGRLLERWTFAFFPTHPDPSSSERCNQTLVRKLSVTLRSLLCFTRLLPAYGMCRGPRAAPGHRRHRFRVEAWPPTSRTPAQELLTQDFASHQSSIGTLRLSVSHLKDLSSLSTGPERAVGSISSAFGSQIERIEMEEGYVAGSAALKTGDLEARDGARCALESAFLQSQDRSSSKEGTVHLGSTPPVGLISLGPQRCDSASSSRSATPQNSPHLGPRPDPKGPALGSRQASPSSSQQLGEVQLGRSAMSSSGGGGVVISLGPQRSDSACSSRSATPQNSPHLGHRPDPKVPAVSSRHASPSSSSHLGQVQRGRVGSNAGSPNASLSGLGAASASNQTFRQPDELNDSLDSMTEWARRRSLGSQSLGSRSRGSQGSAGSPHGSGPPSRSLSPEDSSRMSSLPVAGIIDHRHGGEITMCFFTEDDKAVEEEDETAAMEAARNATAPAVLEAVEEEESPALKATAPAVLEVDAGPAPSSSAMTMSMEETPPTRRLSPLIAQLNPFLSPPPLMLPEAEEGDDLGAASTSAPLQESIKGIEDTSNAHPLFAEMRELVCKMQECRLNLTLQEVDDEDLIARLEHFKEFAQGAGLNRRIDSAQ